MEPLENFDRAAAAFTAVVGGIGPDQFDLPSPCSEWTVRQLLNHLAAAQASIAAIGTGRPMPEPGTDLLGADPRAALAAAVAETRSALDDPTLATRPVPTPMGERPGVFLVQIGTGELVVHGWDVATATGQSTDLDADLAEGVHGWWREMLGDRPRTNAPFAEPTTAPDGASAADRLAAYLGRTVTVG